MKTMKKRIPFSFLIDGKDAWSLPYRTETGRDGDTLTATYIFADGLKVTNIRREYPDGEVGWVNYFENTGDKPTGILSEIRDCDAQFDIGHTEKTGKNPYLADKNDLTWVCCPEGSDWSAYEFSCNTYEMRRNNYTNALTVGKTKKYSSLTGKSSENIAPYFNIFYRGRGIFAAVGWTGQWTADVTRDEDTVSFRSGLAEIGFRLLPGEKIRTSSVVLMEYEGDFLTGQNKWRRFARKYFCGLPEGENMPLCSSFWGGMSTKADLDRLRYIRENKLPYEYLWMDAGWYGAPTEDSPDEYQGDWFAQTGDWVVAPRSHPDGLVDVAHAIHEAGLKYILWFEPERAMPTARIASEHPEYFLSSKKEGVPALMLNLGNEEAWNYVFEAVSAVVERLSVDVFRQDCNFGRPILYWSANDEPERRGMTEIKHIMGLYRLWDALLGRFPGLLIDNCAGGGRRLDIELNRRSIPMWRSDAQCPANPLPEITQNHNMSFPLWVPVSGTGVGRGFDEYCVRSGYTAGFTSNWLYSETMEIGGAEQITHYIEEYKRVRPYFYGDVYPMTEPSDRVDVWAAVQFDRPEEGDGLIEVFRREDSPYEEAVFRLRGIRADREYLFTDIDGGEFTVSGESLARDGFRVRIGERPKAKLFIYRIK